MSKVTIDAPVRFGDNTPASACRAFRQEQTASMVRLIGGPLPINSEAFRAAELATYLRGAAAALENGATLADVVVRIDCFKAAGVEVRDPALPAIGISPER